VEVAVALEKSDGTPAELWGFGGREDGHPVPGEEVIGIFADGAHRNLVQPAERALLRARLAMTCSQGFTRIGPAARQRVPILTAVTGHDPTLRGVRFLHADAV
jgi:hypothetical protein